MKRNFLLCLLLIFGMSAVFSFPAEAAGKQSAMKKEKKTAKDAPKSYCIKIKNLELIKSRQQSKSYHGNVDVSSLPPGKYYIWLCSNSKKSATIDCQINSGPRTEINFTNNSYRRVCEVEIPGKGLRIVICPREDERIKLRNIVLTPTDAAPNSKEIKKFPVLKMIK